MIIVTGTNRSGTSAWMQVLRAAGLPIFGEAFPADWGERLRMLNEKGFYENALREGVYYATNPHPKTGAFFPPAAARRHCLKVFIPGVAQSDLAYLGAVIATVRPWREYVMSMKRLDERDPPGPNSSSDTDRALRWWQVQATLVGDARMRGYPWRWHSYDALVERPGEIVPDALRWLAEQVPVPHDDALDPDAAVAAVDPDARTQIDPEVEVDLPAAALACFDALVDCARSGELPGEALRRDIDATTASLAGALDDYGRRRLQDLLEAKARQREASP